MQFQPATALDAGVPTDNIEFPTSPDKLEQQNIVHYETVEKMIAAVHGRIHAHGWRPDKLELASLLYESGFSMWRIIEHIDEVMDGLRERGVEVTR